MRTATAFHSDMGPGGTAGSDEPTSQGWFRRSDTLGRRNGSITRICWSSAATPGVSSTSDSDRIICSREVTGDPVVYDAPVDLINHQEPPWCGFTYLASPP